MRNERVEKIGKYISILSRQAHRFINRRMQPYGLTSSDHAFLINIAKSPGVNQRCLARSLATDEAVATRVIKRLEDSGFISRKKDPEDMRSFSLYLTERGEELIPALADTFRELDAVLANGFRSAELTSLMEQLKKMTDTACAANEELK